MKRYIVVAYDISNDKRRNKICDILSGYGRRANYSVFECFLGKKDIEKMKERIEQEVKKGKDIVIYYSLCNSCIEKIERVGKFSEEKSMVKVI